MIRSRRYPFLLLEILIAIFLLSVCALPLAHLPMKANEEAIQTAWRMELNRLADIKLSKIKEDLYTETLKKETLIHASKEKVSLDTDNIAISLPLIGSRKFIQTASLSCRTKKNNQGEEYYLLTCIIEFSAKERFKFQRKKGAGQKKRSFTYKLLVVY